RGSWPLGHGADCEFSALALFAALAWNRAADLRGLASILAARAGRRPHVGVELVYSCLEERVNLASHSLPFGLELSYQLVVHLDLAGEDPEEELKSAPDGFPLRVGGGKSNQGCLLFLQ